ncbi:uncharacterized protein PHACADRAFT_255051 [Phanerochaete carnosa HHB-10118-sp]|uniref:Uncharacterized protein n=1 Tax=Phanerochaete carnosa (strain HHB-10118-sp) TaxID=650164 RepID=K5WE78_PHACS|nr:uncharacterized protein PHACADRAFT_255051 [Phanerochaete carnosa HHB-10118-sp]EKM57339.1 hypothetical protein PHACADRAFT_255051 [Phanerochaete carnosa HHB-10118-sp]
MLYYSPTKAEVLEAARSAISIFASYGLSCCLVGGVGCTLFGNERDPNVLFIVALCRPSTEQSTGRGPRCYELGSRSGVPEKDASRSRGLSILHRSRAYAGRDL